MIGMSAMAQRTNGQTHLSLHCLIAQSIDLDEDSDKIYNTSPSRYINMSGYLGDNCIQNFHMGRYIVGYMVRYLFSQ